jgi:beta-carotene 3-hydroxylase
MITNIAIVIGTFCFMEFVAWFTHKFIMHGFLWILHKSHHEPRKGVFELNDFFFLYFGSISALFFIIGLPEMNAYFYAGVGVALYGLAYFIVHDIFIHMRARWFGKAESTYLKALRLAHYDHHATHSKDHATSFGMLVVAKKYFKKAKKHSKI